MPRALDETLLTAVLPKVPADKIATHRRRRREQWKRQAEADAAGLAEAVPLPDRQCDNPPQGAPSKPKMRQHR